MPLFQSLFTTPPERDWTSGLGADGGSWRIRPTSILDDEADDRFPAFRSAWKQGKPLTELFGNDVFALHGDVGPSGADNHRPDVAKVETFLANTGHYRPVTDDGPSGWYGPALKDAIGRFQQDNGLTVDHTLTPGGETIGKLGGLLGGVIDRPRTLAQIPKDGEDPRLPKPPLFPPLAPPLPDPLPPPIPTGSEDGEPPPDIFVPPEPPPGPGWPKGLPKPHVDGENEEDDFRNHTISEDGAEEHDRWAELLTHGTTPDKTAAFLKNVITWSGDQGRGDVADLLGRLEKRDPAKARDLQGRLHGLSGERIPFRVAPRGKGYVEPEPAPLPDPDSFLTEDHLPDADWWSAGNMAEVLSRKGDYKDALTGYFLPQIRANRGAGWTELVTAHAELGRRDPESAVKLADQFEGLTGRPLAFAALADEGSGGGGGGTMPPPKPPEPIPEPPTGPQPEPQPAPQPQPQPAPEPQPLPSPEPKPGPSSGGEKKATSFPPDDSTIYRVAHIEAFKKEALAKGVGYGSGHCVALVQAANPDLPNHSLWKRGSDIKANGDPPLKSGTAIATFDPDGKYPDKPTGQHAAVFLEYGTQNGRSGMWVLDQWKRQAPQTRFIYFDQNRNRQNDAGAYSVVSK
ncbi:MAG: peptidoglycan-binding protein [Magnetospirillum sp.]|nr:peptidoglycan-binding protein [Magnetospirillum sp.]